MDDLLPDFLVMPVGGNRTTNDSSLPNEVHSSNEGEIFPVVSVTTLVAWNSQVSYWLEIENI